MLGAAAGYAPEGCSGPARIYFHRWYDRRQTHANMSLLMQAWAATHWPALAAQEARALQAAAALTGNTGTAAKKPPGSSAVSVHWFGEWGCALLALRSVSADGAHLGAHLDHAALHLVAADEWRYDVRM
jgi:hypothetical protein